MQSCGPQRVPLSLSLIYCSVFPDDSLNAGIKTLGSEGPSGAPAHRLKSQIVRVPKKENVRTLVSTVMLPAKQGNDEYLCFHLVAPKWNG